jgi:CubicO group peptidase (beta-lactamase class C family)
MGMENLGFVIDEGLKKCDEMDKFSGVIHVSLEGEVVYEKSVGFADRSNETVNTIDTSFGIASGAKLFTAVAIMKLVEAGKLSLNDRLKDLIDVNLKNIDDDVSVHHLLTHTSGIEDYFDESGDNDYADSFGGIPNGKLRKVADFLPLIEDKGMKFRPGESVSYSNAGYIFLGLIVEAVSKMEFHNFVESKILKPCRLNSTGYHELDSMPEKTATGYIDAEDDDSWTSNIFSIPAKGGPDGGIFTTAGDLIRFWNILLDGKFLSKEYVDMILNPQVRMNQIIEYGYGVYILREKEVAKKYFIMGMDPGVSFRYSYYPENGYSIVVLGNSEFDDFEINEAVVEAIKGKQ